LLLIAIFVYDHNLIN